jgi:hypothetical protein
MKKLFKILKKDAYWELYGLLIGIFIGIMSYFVFKNILLSIIVGILLSIIFSYVAHYLAIRTLAKITYELNEKKNSIDKDSIENMSDELKNIIELDKELTYFLDKYSSGKENDMYEKRLNEEWKKQGAYFTEKADSIFKKMSNLDLLLATNLTESIYMIVDIFSYFKPFNIDIEYMINNPDNLIPYYYHILDNEIALNNLAINDYYFNKIFEKNKFEDLEQFILSKMSNEELLKLANSSNSWFTKLYYYGFLTKDGKIKEE